MVLDGIFYRTYNLTHLFLPLSLYLGFRLKGFIEMKCQF